MNPYAPAALELTRPPLYLAAPRATAHCPSAHAWGLSAPLVHPARPGVRPLQACLLQGLSGRSPALTATAPESRAGTPHLRLALVLLHGTFVATPG